ncbi:MAG: hypothetical protein DLM54_12335 [Acidimicrobiales bacterium]|nr:MAG: hypothetical protein DLM54_12335 [Acidimicrobiales bacterium]
MAVAVITDSAAALGVELVERLGVTVVPMHLSIGEASYRDDEVALAELVDRIDEGIHTSGPTPGAFVDAIEKADAGDGVVVLTVSSRMSSTYQTAQVAAGKTGGDVRVIDTSTAAGAQGLVVLAAAEAAGQGRDIEQVSAQARRVAARVRLVAAVDSLEYLVRGGRLPEVAGWAGGRLGVRPLFEFRAGRIHALRPSLSHQAAIGHVMSQWRRTKVPGAPLHVAALHALDPQAATRLLDAVRTEVKPVTAFIESFGPVMVAHTGPGVTGLAWWWG